LAGIFFTQGRMDQFIRYLKLLGLHFLVLIWILSMGILFLYSGYKLFYQYHVLMILYHLVMNGRLNFVTVQKGFWGWLFLFVFSWASILAFWG
jgi:hypothetical protein